MSKSWVLGNSVKVRNEIDDYDYIDTLNKDELNWLKGFHREWANADFKHPFKKVHKRKKHIKDIYDQNNARNRCLYGICSVMGLLYLSDEPFAHSGIENKYLKLRNMFDNPMLQDEHYDYNLNVFKKLDCELNPNYIGEILLSQLREENQKKRISQGIKKVNINKPIVSHKNRRKIKNGRFFNNETKRTNS